MPHKGTVCINAKMCSTCLLKHSKIPIDRVNKYVSTKPWFLGGGASVFANTSRRNVIVTESVYKLCTNKGYTWNLSVYVGKDLENKEMSASENVVMKLVKELLNEGRTLYLDNFYTSVPLAYRLLELKTHTVGTLRQNRKYIPQKFNKLS